MPKKKNKSDVKKSVFIFTMGAFSLYFYVFALFLLSLAQNIP